MLKRSALLMERAKSPRADNPALLLGAAMAVLSLQKKDKLTLLSSPAFARFGDWAEQLVAESTGKEGRGVTPVTAENAETVSEYGSDRFFVALAEEKDSCLNKRLGELRQAGHPSLVFRVSAKEDLGAEFYRWEMATAVAGAILGINPFDQPDVQDAKDRTRAVLKSLEGAKKPAAKAEPLGGASLKGRASAAVGTKNPWISFWKGLKVREAVHLLAFLPDRPPIRRALEKMRAAIRSRTKAAVTASLGPRYLHSTGQLHKGGPDNAIFLMLTARRRGRLPVPGEKYSFEELESAQATGDFQALDARGRRVLWIELAGFGPSQIGTVEKAIRKTLGHLS